MCLKLNIKFYVKIAYCVGLYQKKDVENGGFENVYIVFKEHFAQHSSCNQHLNNIIAVIKKMFYFFIYLAYRSCVHYILYLYSFIFHIMFSVSGLCKCIT